MTRYDPAAGRPRRRSTDDAPRLLIDLGPGHRLLLAAGGDTVIERWEQDDADPIERAHPIPWDWTTDPPHSPPATATSDTFEWACPLCEAALLVTTAAQLAAFIASHPCATDATSRGPLRAVPTPDPDQGAPTP